MLVACGLLWSLNFATSSNFTVNFSGKFTPSQNMSEEEEDPESHNFKFFSNNASVIALPRFYFKYRIQDSKTMLSNLAPIPATPPDYYIS